MSDQTRLINEKIKMKSVRRDYYSDNSFKRHKGKETNELITISETSPAGIAGELQTEINNTSTLVLNEPKSTKTTNSYNKISKETKNTEIIKKPFESPTSMYPSYVRFYSLIPNDEEISIISRDTEICKNLKCNSPTEYINIDPGIYDMYFYDKNHTLLHEYKLKAFNCAINTLIVSKTNDEYNVFTLKGITMDYYNNTSYVRFIQTVPNSPAMDIYIDGIPVILGITYNEISEFIGLPIGIHNITVTAAATSIIYADKSFNFSSKSLNDLFIVSDATGIYDLSLLVNEHTCL